MSFRIRRADAADIEDLVQLRRMMFEAMGHSDERALTAMCEESRRYFAEHIPTGAFRAWVAEDGGQAVASIGLVIHSIPPSPDRLKSQEAYIMSLVTSPSHRRQGIAAALLEHVLDAAREDGIPVASLHATTAGRGVYERAGFALNEALPEMHAVLDPGLGA